MRLMKLVTALIMVIPLAACGWTVKHEAKPATAAPPAQTGYDPCDLLSQAERDKAADTVVDFEGGSDFYFPESTCTFGDAPGQTSESSIEYQAMRAGAWAAKVPYLVETTPADREPKAFLAAVLKRAGRSEDELATLDDTESCAVWDAVQAEHGLETTDHLTVTSETAKDESWQAATAMTCSFGVYATVILIAEDANTKAGRSRAVRALGLVLKRATTTLPQIV